jgi:hypothetical protein
MVNIHICWVLEDPFFNKSSVSTWEQIALLLTDLFLYSYKAEILQKIIKEKIIITETEVKVLNIIFRFIGDFLSINNPYFANWILKRTIDDINSFSCTQMTRYSIANYALIQCWPLVANYISLWHCAPSIN